MVEKSIYNSLAEWRKAKPKDVTTASRRGLVPQICEKYGWKKPRNQKPPGYWTYEKCKEEALKYKNRSSFQKNARGAYDKAMTKGWLEEICSHMIRTRKRKGHWSKENCREIALKYKTSSDLGANNKPVYDAIYKKGWLDEFYPIYDNNGVQILRSKIYLTYDETFQMCVDNELTDSGKYSRYRTSNINIKMYSTPWTTRNITAKDFFENIKNKLGIPIKIYLTRTETFQLCVDNKLITRRKYRDFKKDNPVLGLRSPEYVMDDDGEYFQKIKKELGIFRLSPSKVRQLCIDNKLYKYSTYGKFRTNNPNLNLPSQPSVIIKDVKNIDFFKDIKKELGIQDKIFLSNEETFQLCVDNKISSTQYNKFRKTYCDSNLKLRSMPWYVVDLTVKDYFKKVWLEIEKENN